MGRGSENQWQEMAFHRVGFEGNFCKNYEQCGGGRGRSGGVQMSNPVHWNFSSTGGSYDQALRKCCPLSLVVHNLLFPR